MFFVNKNLGRKNFNITAQDLNNFFGGPAFLAWARMGNLHAKDDYYRYLAKLQCAAGLAPLEAKKYKLAARKVQTALHGSGGNRAAVSEGVEASIIYIRFKAAAT